MSNRNRNRETFADERNARRGFSTRFDIAVVIYQAFFRKNMGKRYFDIGIFFAAFIALAAIRVFWTLPNVTSWGAELLFGSGLTEFKFIPFDYFIVLYLIFGAYQLYSQRQMARKGITMHSYYTGDSRFASLGKFINSKDPHTPAYLYIEPLVIIILLPFIFGYSFLLGLIALTGGVRLWVINYRVIRKHRYDEMDRDDGKIIAAHVSKSLDEYEQPTTSMAPPPIPVKAKKMPPPVPAANSQGEVLSPLEALQRINQKQKDQTQS